MDVSKGLHIRIKRMGAFIRSWINQLEHLFRLAVRALTLFFIGFFNYVRFMRVG